MAKSSRMKMTVVVAGLATMALASAAIAGRDQLASLLPLTAAEPAAAVHRAPQPVRVTPVRLVAPDTSQSFTGTVRPQHETVMAFRLPGKIVARLVEVGDRVGKGELVARLDDTDIRLSLEAAEAEVTASQTDLARAVADSRRSQKLFDSGFVARAGLEKTVSATAQAQSRVDRALRLRDQASNALAYAALLADGPGVVTAVAAEAGQVVAAGQPIVTIAPTDKLDVVFALPEQMRTALDGATATAELWGEEGRAYPLSLRDISPDVDPAARTYRVRMALTAPDAAVALGRTMTVTLKGNAEAPVAELPLSAVINDGLGAFVWRVPPGGTAVQRVPVEVASLNGTAAAVRGLAEGDLVISLGAHKIDPDRPVRIVETAAAAPSM